MSEEGFAEFSAWPNNKREKGTSFIIIIILKRSKTLWFFLYD